MRQSPALPQWGLYAKVERMIPLKSAASQVRLVVFDCDGTLVDSQQHILAAMTLAYRESGLGAPDPAAVRALIGLQLEVMVATLLPEREAVEHRALAERYRQAFFTLRREPGYREPLFPGAEAVLDELQAEGFLLGIATGKSRRGLDAVLGAHGLSSRFITLQTADRARGKPDPDMLERAMAETGAAPEEAMLVGDTTFDMEMARNAGVASVGVGWGYHPAVALTNAGAAAVIERFDALCPLAWQFTGGRACA